VNHSIIYLIESVVLPGSPFSSAIFSAVAGHVCQ
jgi:hypothetical protein